MNKLSTALVPTTIGGMAISLIASSWDDLRKPDEYLLAPKPVVQYGGASSTFGHSTSTRRFAVLRSETASLMTFYSDLLANQEELGREFAKVLYENVWDLYAR
jgi:hypothetical protein